MHAGGSVAPDDTSIARPIPEAAPAGTGLGTADFAIIDRLLQSGDFAQARSFAGLSTACDDEVDAWISPCEAMVIGDPESALRALDAGMFHWEADPIFYLDRSRELFARCAMVRGVAYFQLGHATAGNSSCATALTFAPDVGHLPALLSRLASHHATNGPRPYDEPAADVEIGASWRERLLDRFADIALWAMRRLEPYITIRVGAISGRFLGHLVHDTASYLLERRVRQPVKRELDLFYFSEAPCNTHWAKMLAREMRIHPFVARIDSRLSGIPRGSRFRVVTQQKGLYRHGDWNKLWELGNPISFTPAEISAGEDYLRRVGVAEGAPYVCVHVRDSRYFQARYPELNSSSSTYRDAKLEHYLRSISSLAAQGIHVIRLGAEVGSRLPDLGPRVIDYADRHRTPFLDTYLPTHSDFLLGSSSGFSYLAMCFDRPTVITNSIPLGALNTFRRKCIFIPKKLWLTEEKRFLTFREILFTQVVTFYDSESYAAAGIELVENTAAEIEAVSQEMLDRLHGNGLISDEDEERQRRFWRLWENIWPHGALRDPGFRIGAEFLRHNEALLD